ncbi:hypothetical protein [Streptomyces spiramenti]|uniref:LppX_LprAFG lipoprotein n=1 Tax=Streptomyces spiramenti TaxID=2720606 RepID=A0ABX1ATV9_9ACTN|nr:hypothetical protein [Streptomyces spiramenti]NJP69161.1 hypothetical protein [Streptomyces spiramenti]
MRKAITAALAAGVLVSTAACGSDDSSSDSDAKGEENAEGQGGGGLMAALRASQEKSAEAGTVAITSTTSIEMPAQDMSMSFELSGVTGWDPLAMDVTVDMSDFFAMIAEVAGTDAAEAPDGVYQTLLVDNVMYMGGEMVEAQHGEGKWSKIDLNAVDADDPSLGQAAEQIKNAEQMTRTPSQQVAVLLESGDVEHVGSEDLDGRSTEKYEGSLTAEDLLALGGDADDLTEEHVANLLASLEQMGAESFQFTVWVGEDDLPARVDQQMVLTEGSFTVSTVYEEYGVELNVEAPAEADVVDLAEGAGAGR